MCLQPFSNCIIFLLAMKVKFSRPLQNVVGLKGSDAVLRCELHTSKGDVQWLKNNQEITPNQHLTIRADGQERSLTIHNLTECDAGEYTCESKDERTSATVVVKSKYISLKKHFIMFRTTLVKPSSIIQH